MRFLRGIVVAFQALALAVRTANRETLAIWRARMQQDYTCPWCSVIKRIGKEKS